ncbi:MAG TPA: hypothetical protein VGW38_15700 [Chloroflexota bacterium]|nr:hypothetical protein [Chloroflexota bacterium]
MTEVVQLLQAEEVPKHNIVRLAEDLAGWESQTSIHGWLRAYQRDAHTLRFRR